MVGYYYPIGLRTCRTWQKWMTGDGHKMGVWVGAKMEDPGQYVSHMMGTVAPAAVMRSDERMMQTESQAFITPWVEWALPSNALAPVLYVNQKGERFMNEEIGYFMSGPTIDKQPEGLFWAFWDGDSETKVKPHKFDRLVDGIDTDEHSEMMVEAGLLIKADTIDELIEKMNAPEWDNGKFDGEKFKETLAHYNELCAAGSDDDFYKPVEWMTTIDTPPFYAAEMGSSWMTTVGDPRPVRRRQSCRLLLRQHLRAAGAHEPFGPFHDALLRGRAQLRRRHIAARRPNPPSSGEQKSPGFNVRGSFCRVECSSCCRTAL